MRSLGKLALGIALASLVGCFTTVDQGPPPAAPPPPAAEPVQFEPAPATAEIPELPTADPGEIMATSEPPEPVYEEQTPPPAPDHVWVPGYWDWTGAQWSWVYGGWRPPMVGYTYVAPYYEVVNGQVVYVRGYWNAGPPVVRAYGGVRISFVAAPRPVGYRPGVRVVVRPTAGVRVGVRPASVYVKVGPATRTPQPRPAVRPAPAHHAAPPPAHHAAPAAHPAPAPAAHPAPAARPAPAPAAHPAPAARPAPAPAARPAPAPAPRPAARPAPAPAARPAARPAPAPRPAAKPAPAPARKKR